VARAPSPAAFDSDFWEQGGPLGGPSYREAKGGNVEPQPFWQARYYDFKLWI
jgi:hypothetical protein